SSRPSSPWRSTSSFSSRASCRACARARRLLGRRRAPAGALGAHRLARGRGARRPPALACGRARLLRERLPRCGGAAVALEDARGRPRPLAGLPAAWMALPAREIPRRLAPGPLRGPCTGRRQLHPGSTSLRQADGDGLLRRCGAVLGLADVLDLLVDEFTGLGARGLPFSSILPRAFDDFLLRHEYLPDCTSCACVVHHTCHPRLHLRPHLGSSRKPSGRARRRQELSSIALAERARMHWPRTRALVPRSRLLAVLGAGLVARRTALLLPARNAPRM